MATLLQLRAFIAVVDQGGFTAAGDRLELSQPAVSRAVASLEKELGSPLLIRSRDGVALTTAGATALTHAREAVRHLGLMHTEVVALADQVIGSLNVASLPSATGTLIAPHLRAFADRYPAVAIRLLEGSEQEVQDWLDRGAADVAVVRLPVRGLSAAFLGEQLMMAVLPVGHPLSALDEVSYAALAREPFVQSTGGCAEVFNPVARQLNVEFDTAFEARELSAVVELVRGGLGVSILPSVGASSPPDGVVLRPLVPRTVRPLGVAISASASAAAHVFIDRIRATSTGEDL
jgi:DNA-binding transcriptional LysR family regulator